MWIPDIIAFVPRSVKVAAVEHFGPGKRKKVFVRDRRIAVFNDTGKFYAVDDTCTHVGGSLSEGLCEDGIITCPWHSAQFRLKDGRGIGEHAYRSLATYPISVKNGVVEVEIADLA